MKVKLKDIKSNPWRYINDGYPIDSVKVERLRDSIKRTGFWDNLVARKTKEGEIQIAYGHHRIDALRKDNPGTHEIDVILKDLTDEDMLKIMASENDTMDNMPPGIINETVKAALSFIKLHPVKLDREELKQMEKERASDDGAQVSKFLNWNLRRVTEAIRALKSFEDGKISRKEYESMPTQRAAITFRNAIANYPLSKDGRQSIIQSIISDEIGSRSIRNEVFKASLLEKNPKAKTKINLDDVSRQIARNIQQANVLMTESFISNTEHISEAEMQNLQLSLNQFVGKIKKVRVSLNGKKTLLLTD